MTVSSPTHRIAGLTITEHFQKLGKVFAADTETAMAPDAFRGPEFVRIFTAANDDYSFLLDLAQFGEAEWSELRFNLERKDLTLIFHNAAFDLRVLQGCNIEIRGTVHDTMIQSQLLHNGAPNVGNSLQDAARRELNVTLDKTYQKASWMTLDLAEHPDAERYAIEDAETTFDLHRIQIEKIMRDGLDIAYEVELKALRPTIEMESTGLFMNRELLDEQVEELIETRDTSLAAFIEELDGELQSAGVDGLPRHEDGSFNLNKTTRGSVRLGTKVYAGFNTGSAQQVLRYFNAIGIDPRDPSGKPSVDKKYLALYKGRSVVDIYLQWKRADKHLQMCKTLIDAQQEDGRIYARFNPGGTFTGRYSSSGPNLQNLPRGAMRYVFTAPPGRAIVDLDYSGMELRALCSPRIADEPAMQAAFNEGRDVHRATAALMFDLPEEEITDEQRRLAKAVNFGAAYGSGAGGLCNYFQSIGQFISLAEAQTFRDAWLKAYPKIAAWHQDCRNWVEAGEPVRMVDGRRRFLFGDAAKHTTMANNVCQGSCASAMKLALAAICEREKEIDPTSRLIGVIHDEVLIECDENKADAILEMAEKAMVEAGIEIFGDTVLLEAEGGIGDSWGSAKS
jgi:DNA polymerase-1